MASNLLANASNLIEIASKLLAMASNLVAMGLETFRFDISSLFFSTQRFISFRARWHLTCAFALLDFDFPYLATAVAMKGDSQLVRVGRRQPDLL